MDGQQPNFDLPKPLTDGAEADGGAYGSVHHEKQAAAEMQTSAPQPQPAAHQGMQNPLAAMVTPPLPVAPAPALPAAPVQDDLSAEDVDLIEKAWVQKAKAIVDQTSSDPYRQNLEINKMKVDYIKKRYNKDLKVGE